MKKVKILWAAGLVICGLSGAMAGAGHAAAWSSQAQYGSWQNGGYTIYSDIWGTKPGSQTTWANSYSQWGVTCKYTGPGIKSYPDVSKEIRVPVDALRPLISTFNATTPKNAAYDLAYDIWCNHNAYETMIWVKWNGTQPIAAAYTAKGKAVPTLTNQLIDGQHWNVYRRGTVVSLLRTRQENTGKVNIKDVLAFINTHGWFHNPTLSRVQFGWEITNTDGKTENFRINKYSVTQPKD